jgi:hypothetical protein
MENYSIWADLLHTFRMMSDGVKISLIYMPCVFALGFAGLYMHHLRRANKADAPDSKPYMILPPDKPLRREPEDARARALRKLDAYIAAADRPRKE